MTSPMSPVPTTQRRPPMRRNALAARGVTLSYDERVVCEALSLEVPDHGFTVIIGPNACGKSTLLRALTRLLRPDEGHVLLDGQDVHGYRAKDFARRVGLLPQTSNAPEGIRARDLVARGRYPYQTLLRQWSVDDEEAVSAALRVTNTTDLADEPVDELSGGQRQRIWIAMALAQETGTLFLDEPTTYLDVAHQIDLLELLTDLHLQGRALVAVLHDLNQAARYATHLIVMKAGAVVVQGPPHEVVTESLVEEVFGLSCLVQSDPICGAPMIIPRGRERTAGGAAPTQERRGER